jgi:hypothetical protein
MNQWMRAGTTALALCVAVIGCKPPGGQDAASPDESDGIAADGSGATGASSAQVRTVDFDGERYLLGRAYVSGKQTINEYYRQGESVAAWQQVITVTDYPGATDLNAFVKTYSDSVSSGLAVNKDSYDYGTDTKIVSSDAVGPDRTELAMLRAVLIANMGIRSYLFVARIPSADKAKIAAYRAKTQQWINQITEIDAAPVAH